MMRLPLMLTLSLLVTGCGKGGDPDQECEYGCNVDFPCYMMYPYMSYCTTDRTRRILLREVSCAEFCDVPPECCGGGTCSQSYEDCGVDEICTQDQTGSRCEPLDVCPADPVWEGGECPEPCTGGCEGGSCLIDCSGPSDCSDATAICPEGLPCMVDCSGENACANAVIQCPDSASCELICDNPSLPYYEQRSCLQAELRCGARACSARCPGEVKPFGMLVLSQVDCGESCSCHLGGCY